MDLHSKEIMTHCQCTHQVWTASSTGGLYYVYDDISRELVFILSKSKYCKILFKSTVEPLENLSLKFHSNCVGCIRKLEWFI